MGGAESVGSHDPPTEAWISFRGVVSRTSIDTVAAIQDSVPDAPSAKHLEIVLGIDPGTRNVGYGAVVVGARGPRLYAAGVLRARQSDVPTRLGQLRGELDLLLQRVKPTVVVVEAAFVARSVSSALRIGEGRGVVLACASGAGAKVVEYPPAVAKRALVGNGAADKTQVARMVEHILGPKARELPVDASDALALALAYAQRAKELR